MSRPAPQADRFPCFDGLRAMAAIAVVLHHASIATAFSLRGPHVPFTPNGRLGGYFAHMDAGVQVFFLISGFLLYRPFVAVAFADRPPTSLRSYGRRRFLRIYPAYWVAFASIALLVGIDMPVGGGRSILEYFFLLHLYDTSSVLHGGRHVWRALGGISQSWTLVVEVSFYLLLPVYAALLRRLGGRRDPDARLRLELWMLVVLYAVSLGWRAVAQWGVPRGSSFAFLGMYWLPANLDLFAMGMGLAVVRAWVDATGRQPRALALVGRVDWLWWACAAVAFHVACFWIGLPSILTIVRGGKVFLRQLLYGLTALFLLLPAVFGPQDRGVTRRFLRLRPVAYLGTVSYGIYLWHQAFIKKIHQWGGWDKVLLPNGPFLVHVIGALAGSIVIATLSWHLLERPLLRRKDRPLLRARVAAA